MVVVNRETGTEVTVGWLVDGLTIEPVLHVPRGSNPQLSHCGLELTRAKQVRLSSVQDRMRACRRCTMTWHQLVLELEN